MIQEQQAKDTFSVIIERIKKWYRGLPDKKRYLEFITAFLTIPVLLTVLLNNVSNIQKQSNLTPTPTNTSIPMTISPPIPTREILSNTPSSTPAQETACKKEVGPMDILYPNDQDQVSGNPICIELSKQQSNYCSAVWSYRLNGGAWSNYTDRAICMYGLSSGTKKLELRIKSIVSGDELILTRIFTVINDATPTPASQSAQIQQ